MRAGRPKSPSSERSEHEDELDLVFAALANRTRRALLGRLGAEPAKITDLAAPFDMSLPAVSKHLRVLERAGLVQREIDGRVHRCSLDAAPLQEAERWLHHHRVFWEETLDALAAFVEGGHVEGGHVEDGHVEDESEQEP